MKFIRHPFERAGIHVCIGWSPQFFSGSPRLGDHPENGVDVATPAGEGEVPPLEEVDPWKLLDLMDIGCLEMGWSWGVCLLFCFFWIFFVQVIWHRSAWGDFLWVFLGDFGCWRSERPGCSEPMMFFSHWFIHYFGCQKMMGKPNHPSQWFITVRGVMNPPIFRDIQTSYCWSYISSYPKKLYFIHVYPCFSIFSMCKNPKSCWLKVPKSLAFRHSFVTPPRLWRATLLQVLLGGLDDVGAESGSAAIDLTTGISWVFGWLKWMFLLDWGKKSRKL